MIQGTEAISQTRPVIRVRIGTTRNGSPGTPVPGKIFSLAGRRNPQRGVIRKAGFATRTTTCLWRNGANIQARLTVAENHPADARSSFAVCSRRFHFGTWLWGKFGRTAADKNGSRQRDKRKSRKSHVRMMRVKNQPNQRSGARCREAINFSSGISFAQMGNRRLLSRRLRIVSVALSSAQGRLELRSR